MQKKDYFLKLTPTDKEVAIASVGIRIKDLKESDFKTKIIHLIGQTHLNCGFKLDENQLSQTIDELCSDLLKCNFTLSFAEIELAFKNGWKKEYGDFFGLNNATYFGWVNAYTFGEKRLRVKKTIADAKANEGKEPEKKTPEEADYILKEACLKSFDEFRKGVAIFDHGNVKYNYLVKVGVLNFTKERKEAIKTMVEARVKAEVIETKGKAETIEKALSRIQPDSIISASKKEALNQFFKDLADTETELSDLL